MPPPRKPGPKSSAVSGKRNGSRVQVEDVRLQDVKDEFEDMNSDQDPDDPDSLSDTDRNSLSELSDETERKVKKTKGSSFSEFSDTSSDEPLDSLMKKPKTGESAKTNLEKKDFLDTSSDEDKPLKSPKPKAAKRREPESNKFAEKSTPKEKRVESTKTDSTKKDDITSMDDPNQVSFNQYYRHKCKLAGVKSAKQITGQDVCKPDRPAELTLEKLKLHYVVHYLYRGTWDHIVPEEDPALLGKIECYICNICHKRFKNHLEKKEYPGRGSVLCHLATDHGLLFEAMWNEKEVDLNHDIKILVHNDKQFKETWQKGPETAKIDAKDLVSSKESMLWRLNQSKKSDKQSTNDKAAESADEKSPKENVDAESSSSDESNSTVDNPPSKSNGSQAGTNATPSKPSSKPSLLECPHCDELKGNDDAPNLRLHIFHHYKDHWTERINKLAKGDKSFFCDRCPKKKKITGATPEGTRTAAVCHFAIQHYELRGVLESDERLSKKFVNDLYWDHDNPSSAASSYYISQSNLIKSQNTTPRGRPSSKKATTSKRNSSSEELDTTDLSSFDMSDDSEEDNVKKRQKWKRSTKKTHSSKKSSTTAVLPGETNPNYIRKRGKINISLDSDEDSASDHSWELSSKSKSSKKRRTNSSVKKVSDDLENSSKKARHLPKRSATKQEKVWSFLNEDEDEDE